MVSAYHSFHENATTASIPSNLLSLLQRISKLVIIRLIIDLHPSDTVRMEVGILHPNSHISPLGIDNKHLFRWIALLLTAVIILNIMSFWHFNQQVYQAAYQQNFDHAKQTALYFTRNFQTKIESCYQILENIEALIEPKNNLLEDDVLDQLQCIQRSTSFSFLGVVDLDGNAIDTNGLRHNIEDESFFQQVLSGNRYISDIFSNGTNTNSNTILMAIPIYQNKVLIGALFGKYLVDEIVSDIEFDTGKGNYFQIIDSQGHYISRSQSENLLIADSDTLWDELIHYDFETGVSAESIRSQVLSGESGSVYCCYQSKGRYVTYQPIGINQWYVFAIMPEENINSNADVMLQLSFYMIIQVVLELIIIMVLIILYARRVYQVIHDKNTALEVHNRLFQLVLQKTNDIPFEINLYRDEITLHSPRFKNGYMHTNLSQLRPSTMIRKGELDEVCYEDYKKIYHNLLQCNIGTQAVVRLRFTDQLTWFKLMLLDSYQITSDTHIVGLLEYYEDQKQKDMEIERRKQQALHLSKRSQYDFLTGLLNRATFEQQADQCLRLPPNKIHAFLIVDLDHFKEINDTFGHGKGDEVLRDVAGILSKHFRKDDLIGRLGGDEFVILLHNLEDDSVIQQLASSLCQSMQRTYTVNDVSLSISASIGIAQSPNDGTTFAELYPKADMALYHVKRNGKNNFYIYGTDNEN